MYDVHVNWCGIFPCEPDWTWDTATTPLRDFDLWAVFEGAGVMTAPDRTVTLASGDCLLLRPGERYVCRTETAVPLLVHVVHFDYVDARARAVTPPALPPLHRPLIDVTFFRELTTRVIERHLDRRADEADVWLRAALRELAAADAAHAASGTTDPQLQRIENICAGIARAPERRWVITELARKCAVSPDHFTRLFKQHRGVTPREFILRQRVDAAKRLLLASSHSVGRIAELTGFSDIYHFSRQFKAHAGRSPTRFRRGG
jgi:AraC-like DNA-binding protein